MTRLEPVAGSCAGEGRRRMARSSTANPRSRRQPGSCRPGCAPHNGMLWTGHTPQDTTRGVCVTSPFERSFPCRCRCRGTSEWSSRAAAPPWSFPPGSSSRRSRCAGEPSLASASSASPMRVCRPTWIGASAECTADRRARPLPHSPRSSGRSSYARKNHRAATIHRALYARICVPSSAGRTRASYGCRKPTGAWARAGGCVGCDRYQQWAESL